MGEDWVNVGKASELPARVHLNLKSRRITVLRVPRGGVHEFTAFDSLCYHAGGALGLRGSISVVDGRICLTCPLHMYVLDVFTGQRVVRGDEFHESSPSNLVDDNDDNDDNDDVDDENNHALSRDFSKRFKFQTPHVLPGVRQRIHDVRVENGVVQVRLRLTDPLEVPSDMFAYRPRFTASVLDW